MELTQFCRKGKERFPREHVVAVQTKASPAKVRFRSERSFNNYAVMMAEHDHADADLYVKTYLQFIKDTKEYRTGRKEKMLRTRGEAHCHKAKWLMARKDFSGPECLLFPNMLAWRTERVKYNYRTMAAARAMLVMTAGLPEDGKEYALHICGNGHLSCVNPAHLRWGSLSDNAKDTAVHNAPSEFMAGMDPAAIDEIRSSQDLVKVAAWKSGIPAGVVSAIKRGDQWAQA